MVPRHTPQFGNMAWKSTRFELAVEMVDCEVPSILRMIRSSNMIEQPASADRAFQLSDWRHFVLNFLLDILLSLEEPSSHGSWIWTTQPDTVSRQFKKLCRLQAND